MKFPPNVTILLTALLLASCASYAPRVDEAFTPDQNTAVVYGRFKFTDNINASDTSIWAYRMALQFVNESTRSKTLVRFSKNEPVACVRLSPGRYKLTGFVATDASDHVLGGKEFGPEDKINVSFEAQPHSAVYLGDYSGFAKYHSFGDLNTFETGLTEVTNRFTETTATFQEKYPNLKALPAKSAF